MNIFVLDRNPIRAARMLADKHCSKMLVESTQMLAGALLKNGCPSDKMPLTQKGTHYKGAYPNHPCSIWTAESTENFAWLWTHAFSILQEYKKRYNKTTHGCEKPLMQMLDLATIYMEDVGCGMTPFVRALNQSKGENLDLLDESIDTVTAYREFYIRDKSRFATWERGTFAPSWWRWGYVKGSEPQVTETRTPREVFMQDVVGSIVTQEMVTEIAEQWEERFNE